MARKIEVEILGDSSSLERAFASSARSAQKFNQQLASSTTTGNLNAQTSAIRANNKANEDAIKIGARRSKAIGPFRVAGIGLGAGLGLFAATQVVRELGDRLETTGAEAFTATGKLKNFVSALSSGSIIGAVEALTRSRKNFADFGITMDVAKSRMAQYEKILNTTKSSLLAIHTPTRGVSAAQRELMAAMDDAGVKSREETKILRDAVNAHNALTTATAALVSEQQRLGQVMVTTAGQITRFRGRPDDMPRAGRGEPVSGVRATPSTPFRPSLTPSQRRELALTGQQGAARLPGLRDRLAQLQNMRKAAHTDAELLKIMTDKANTEAEIAAVMADIAAARKAAAAAAAAAAEAARQQRIATATGWLEFAVERAEATKPIRDDLKAWREIESYYEERIRQEGRKLELVRELWRARDRIKNLRKGGDSDPLAGLMQASTKQLTRLAAAGTGLRGAGLSTLSSNLSGLQMRPVYVAVNIDGREVGRAVTKDQARTGKRTARQTSGSR